MGFKKLDERIVWQGTLVSAGTGTFVDPDGNRFERDVVHHPGAVVVVPVVDGDVILVRQYRAAIDSVLLELPAGKRDVADEPVALTASRELEEEVGMRAAAMEQIAEFYNSPGFCDEHSYLFLATGLTPCATSFQGHEEQHMTIERVPLDAVPDLVSSGEIVDAKSIIGLCLARERLRRS
ncbi:MAG TPA: NUDIX hydrolase [Acidimicrobiales bacterium]|nr:NUDIX hydrolase [Acidimicrobiales bacterium]